MHVDLVVVQSGHHHIIIIFGGATGVYDDIEQRGKFDIVWHILYWCV
jgi:23S rRNA pseudoU1915 N3-methylase RlmH